MGADNLDLILEQERARHNDPDQQADYLKALDVCLEFDRPVPKWLAISVGQAIRRYQTHENTSVNEALGQPNWEKSELIRTTICKTKIVSWTDMLIRMEGGSARSHFPQVQKWLAEDGYFLSLEGIANYYSGHRRRHKGG